jgi:hypothetical protein
LRIFGAVGLSKAQHAFKIYIYAKIMVSISSAAAYFDQNRTGQAASSACNSQNMLEIIFEIQITE